MKRRHNAVSDIIRDAITKHSRNTRIHEDSTIRGTDNRRLTGETADLKPDLWFRRGHTLYLVEITIPYANGPTTLEDRYNGKVTKYEALRHDCHTTFGDEVKQVTIVVSSLGAIYKESIKDLKLLLDSKEARQKVWKRIVVATIRESKILLGGTANADQVSSDDEQMDLSDDDPARQRGDELGDNAGDLPNWQRNVDLSESDGEIIPEDNPVRDRLFHSASDSNESSAASE